MGEVEKKPSWVRYAVWGTVAPLALCCIGSALTQGGPNVKTQAPVAPRPAEPAAPSAATEPAMDVTALKLWDDYEANEVAADGVYKGKTLRVSGKVRSITKDFTDAMIVDLAARNQFMEVKAYLDDTQKSVATKLKKGQSVVVTCEGNGLVIGSPILRHCMVE